MSTIAANWLGSPWFVKAASAALSVVFLGLVSLYLWLTLRDVLAALRNYNLPRAARCRWDSCALYYHRDPKNDQTSACLNPFVSQRRFRRRSHSGTRKGCSYSLAVLGARESDAPAENLREYLDTVVAFRAAASFYPVLLLLLGVVLLVLGLVSADRLLGIE